MTDTVSHISELDSTLVPTLDSSALSSYPCSTSRRALHPHANLARCTPRSAAATVQSQAMRKENVDRQLLLEMCACSQ
jgi:hypothetical protein